MRPQEDLPRRPRRRRDRAGRPGRGRVILIVAAVLLFVLITSLRTLAGFYTDYLWFDSVHLAGVWRTLLGAKSALTAIFLVAFFAMAWVNLFIADRLAPQFPPSGPQEEIVQRYRMLVGRHTGVVRAGVAFLFALIASAGVSSKWTDWLLFTHRVDFGQKDATFHTDFGFYVFQLPFLSFVIGWLFTAVLIIVLLSIAAHYLNGGIRSQGAIQRVTPQVKAHLSVLLGVLALVKAAQYWLSRYELTFSTRGTVDGATYTNSNVQLKVLYLLVIISFFAFGLFIVNIWRRGWVLPVLAVGLWAFVAILAGELVPTFVQRFRVQPSESAKEAPYIKNNIAATRFGLNLGSVGTKPFAATAAVGTSNLQDNAGTVSNIRLWDPNDQLLGANYQQTQALKAFYAIHDVDIDRYKLNGATGGQTQVMIAGRDLNSQGAPGSWESQHLLYTHGYGVVMSPANATTTEGGPKLVVSGIPIITAQGAPKVTQPRIYIGEQQTDYAVVNSNQPEIDYVDNKGTKRRNYDGKDGVKLGGGVGGFMRRSAFALRFGDPNLLISGNITAKSKILLDRNVRQRLQDVAPFLSFDHDPYLVVDSQGRMKWILDAYTTTNRLPNAQRAVTDDVDPNSDLKDKSFNYARNSVKGVVDAYDGTIKLYVIDHKDPLIRSYQKSFPNLFTSDADAPAELRDHFRYPEDLFTVQTTMWGRYHIDKPDDFYSQQDSWNVAGDPGVVRPNAAADASGNGGATTTTAPNGAAASDRNARKIPPYYQLMRLPNEDTESFVLLRPFVPRGGPEVTKTLRAFMVAKSDPEHYGQLEAFDVPNDAAPPGPEIAASKFNADKAVSYVQTVQNQNGSQVLLGNLILVPIDQSVLYVRPLYVQTEGSNKVPLLKNVLVGYQDAKAGFRVALGNTLADALTQLFGSSPNTQEATAPGNTNPGIQPTSPGTAKPGEDKLLADIDTAFANADTALGKGDLGGYQKAVNDAKGLIEQLKALRTGGATGTATGTTATTPGPSTPSTTAPSSTAPSASTPTTAPAAPATGVSTRRAGTGRGG